MKSIDSDGIFSSSSQESPLMKWCFWLLPSPTSFSNRLIDNSCHTGESSMLVQILPFTSVLCKEVYKVANVLERVWCGM